LRGQGAELPCGVWGNAPTVLRATNPKEVANKGAGSEASLPVTLRIRRCAPNLLYPLLAHCRAKWARPDCWSCDHSYSSPQAEDFASAEATRGQWKRTKSAIAPLTPSARTLPRSFAPFGNLRRHFSPKIKKGDLFPAESISRKRSSFYSLLFSRWVHFRKRLVVVVRVVHQPVRRVEDSLCAARPGRVVRVRLVPLAPGCIRQ